MNLYVKCIKSLLTNEYSFQFLLNFFFFYYFECVFCCCITKHRVISTLFKPIFHFDTLSIIIFYKVFFAQSCLRLLVTFEIATFSLSCKQICCLCHTHMVRRSIVVYFVYFVDFMRAEVFTVGMRRTTGPIFFFYFFQ